MPSTVKERLLVELTSLTQKPLTPNEERLRRHLECDKCVKLCSALAEAVQPYRNKYQRVLDAPTELLAPLL